MKTIALSFIFLVSTISNLLTFSDTDSPIVKENRNLTGFQCVEANSVGNVYITEGDIFEVIVETEQKYISQIETDVENGKLVISTSGKIQNIEKLNIYVKMPNVQEVKSKGSGVFFVKTIHNSSSLILSLNGSGDIRIENCIISDIKAVNSGSGSIHIKKGEANNGLLILKGSGNIKAKGVKIGNCEAKLSGVGDIECNVSDKLNASVSGVGKIKYAGSPKIKQNISGIGSIEKI